MNKVRLILWTAMFLMVGAAGYAGPWIEVVPDETVHTFLEFPAARLQTATDEYVGAVFEDRFKFYRIYHGKETADPSKRGQVVRGKTHFTARIVKQYTQVIRIQITPCQEKWIRERGLDRQDVIVARIRFAGIAPDGSLAFDLLEIMEY